MLLHSSTNVITTYYYTQAHYITQSSMVRGGLGLTHLGLELCCMHLAKVQHHGRPVKWPIWSGSDPPLSTKPVRPACRLKTHMGAKSFSVDTFCWGEACSSGQNSENSLTPQLVGRGLAAPSQKPISTPTINPQTAALWALPRPPRLCHGNDLLRNFSVSAGLGDRLGLVLRSELGLVVAVFG